MQQLRPRLGEHVWGLERARGVHGHRPEQRPGLGPGGVPAKANIIDIDTKFSRMCKRNKLKYQECSRVTRAHACRTTGAGNADRGGAGAAPGPRRRPWSAEP